MTSQELAKSIEAKKLNKRSKLPLPEPPAIIPFGALIQDIEEDGGLARFAYLGEMYQCSLDLLHRAVGAGGTVPERAAHEAAAGSGPADTARAEALFHWREIPTNLGVLQRANVPGGWLVMSGPSRATAFYPDPDHAWDGQTQD
ncbi:MAG: hypothetical protein M3Y57_06680 [Acidobacteriota bacterium]|nr:hypothetical protein [Acidobacteriota bacterium]